MKLKNSHKALAITLLFTGTLVLSIFNLSVYKLNPEVAELLIPIEIIEETEKEPESELKDNSKQTNKGFNETKKYKHFAQAYKPIAPPKDYDYSKFNARNDKPAEAKKAEKNTANSNIKNEELTAFNSVNSILNKRSNTKATKETAKASANLNSTIIYSLKGRTDQYLPIPIYLCEANGKIIVNITVNGSGKVIDAYVNNTSTSTNQCLRDHAIEYAKKARFDGSSIASQIGSITFNFKGK